MRFRIKRLLWNSWTWYKINSAQIADDIVSILDFTRNHEPRYYLQCNLVSHARDSLPFSSFSRHKSYYLSAIPFGRLRSPNPPPFTTPLRVALPFRPLVFHPLHVSRAFSSSILPRLASFISDTAQSAVVTVAVATRRLKYRRGNYITSYISLRWYEIF